MSYQDVFERCEKKYLLSQEQYHELRIRLREYTQPDQFGKSTILSLYFDTPDHRMIRASLDRPAYKEKLRLRSYGVPEADSIVFPELKKKTGGIVYKRRVGMPLAQAMDYLCGEAPAAAPSQITGEIDWVLARYGCLVPSMLLSCVRTALVGLEDPGLRITFDSRIYWREMELSLACGAWGMPLLEPGQRLLELKLLGAMPLWLAHMLDRVAAYPTSFSKYGSAYLASQEAVRAAKQRREAEVCA